jgi:hypothetical protein
LISTSSNVALRGVARPVTHHKLASVELDSRGLKELTRSRLLRSSIVKATSTFRSRGRQHVCLGKKGCECIGKTNRGNGTKLSV